MREGILPGLFGLRAEAGNDGTPWLALQQTAPGGSVSSAVRLFDPTLGVRAGDTVVIDPTGLGTCTTFEATITDVVAPDPIRPGGYVRLGHRVLDASTPAPSAATLAAWNRCVDELPASTAPGIPPFFAATFRASGYVLLRGSGTVRAPRRPPGDRRAVPGPLAGRGAPQAASCPLPPAAPWPTGVPLPAPANACDAACRERCQLLQQVRLARRNGYVVEAPAGQTGPALGFTLALEQPTAVVPRDLAINIDTSASDARVQFRLTPSAGSIVNPRAVVPFDRSVWGGGNGPRLLVPYAGGIVLDGSPTFTNGAANTIH